MLDFEIVRWSENTAPYMIDDFICEIQKDEFALNSPEKYNFCIYNMSEYYCGNNHEIDFFIALINKNIVGTIGLRKLDACNAELRKFYVHKNYRRDGIGNKLFEQLLHAAKANRYKKIYTGTMKEKVRAQVFYEKHYFKKIAQETLPLTFQTQALDEIFYVLTL